MKILDFIACLLVLVGALNWGLIGIFNFDLVEELCDAIGGDKIEGPKEGEGVGEAADRIVGEVADAVSGAGEDAEDALKGGSGMTFLQRVIYILIGASAVFMLLRLPAKCGKKSC
ncbi:MAG: DUF378 domain-containing protein [Planctomycetota bacterium]|jgi:uncharacterized membrane protein YuzA (DUF378 family)